MFTASTNIHAQSVAINGSGSTADASAMLDVSSTSKGMLIPRMTNAQRNAISTPATGLMIYQTDGTVGFYYYDGSSWTIIGGGAPSGSAGGSLTGTYPNPTIASGTITNTQVSGTAAIAYSKLNLVNSVQNSDIVANAITTSKVANGTVTTSKMADSAITGLKILSNAVGTVHITAGAITLPKLSATGTPSSTTFLRGDNSWAAPFSLTTTGSGAATFSSGVLNIPTPSGSGSTLDLVATQTGSQTLPIGGPSVTPDDIIFNNVVTTPTVGSYNTSTGVYTVGSTGLYMITVHMLGTGSTAINVVPQVLVNGSTVLYGIGLGNTNLPTGVQQRGELTAVLSLSSGNTVKIKASISNTSTTVPLSADGTTRFTIVKL